MFPREACLQSPILIWGLAAFGVLLFATSLFIPLQIYLIHRAVGPRMPEPYLMRVMKVYLITGGLSHLTGALVIFWVLFRFELAALGLASLVSLYAAGLLAHHRRRIIAGLLAYVELVKHVERGGEDRGA